MATATRRFVVSMFFLIALGACGTAPPEGLGDAPPAVYRFVLDGRPRMVVVPLDDEMWLAYDATHGSLVRAWKGGVRFEGSVYSGQHGPQPTTLGQSWAEGPVDRRVWRLERDGRAVDSEVRYLGYALRDGKVEMRYALHAAGGREIRIDETPHREATPSGGSRLVRRFRAAGLSRGEAAVLETFSEDGRAPATVRLGPDGDELVHVFDAAAVAGAAAGSAVPYPSSDLLLPSETEADAGAGPVEIVLEIPPTSTAPIIDGDVDAAWAAAPARPIAKTVAGVVDGEADIGGTFRVLHDVDHLYVLFEVRDDRIVNDSSLPFHDDSVEVYLDGGHERSPFFDENDAQYIFGVDDDAFWVNTNTADHPGVVHVGRRTADGYRVEVKIPWANVGVSPAPGKTLGFEVHIDDDDDGKEYDTALSWHSAAKDTWSDASRMAAVQLGGAGGASTVPSAPREPGVAMRAYLVGRSLGELRRLVPGQTPNVNRLIETIDVATDEDFGGLAEQFMTELIGYVVCDRAGVHRFRLTADDGARLWIDNRPVADVTANASRTSEGELTLSAGEHRLLLRHFQDGGPKRIRLEWMRPGDEEFSVVPPSALKRAVGGVLVTSPGRKRILEPRVRLRPGDGIPLADVHPAWTISPARPEGFRPRVGGIDFLPDGRMLVCSWDPRGDVWLLDDVASGDPERITATRIATGLAEPLGLCVHEGRIFVLQKQELTELVDIDGDDVIDEYRCVAAGWGVTPNFHEFAFGLVHDGEAFWATLATAIEPGGANTSPQHPDRGRAIRIFEDGRYDFASAGFRTPNGVGLGPDGMILVTDNQGDWLPASKLVHARRGSFYGNRAVDPEGTRDVIDTPPIVWLPQGEIGNSPSEPTLLRGGPYAGQIVHGDVTHGGLKRTSLQLVDGVAQGTVFRFMQGLEAGINRIAYGPDGGLYVGGIGSTGNWGQNGKLRYGLQRLVYNGAPVFEMLSIEVLSNGLEITFTEPLAEGLGWDVIDYTLRDWTYRPTREYGGPKIDERDLKVLSASVSADRRKVFLELPELRTDRVVHTHLSGAVVGASGRTAWTTEAWTTINRIPRDRPGRVLENPHERSPNRLDPEERALGFTLLFDGSSLDGFRGYGGKDAPRSWFVRDGEIRFDPAQGDGGDLVTRATWADFELRFEWAVEKGGNTGVFYRVDESVGPPWETGLEYQLLDDARHPDGGKPETSTAACYALYAASAPVMRAAGLYNRSRIVVRGDDVRHFLNGVEVVHLTLGSADWNERLRSSKFADYPRFGAVRSGAIVLQDHGDPVRFRSLRIRELR